MGDLNQLMFCKPKIRGRLFTFPIEHLAISIVTNIYSLEARRFADILNPTKKLKNSQSVNNSATDMYDDMRTFERDFRSVYTRCFERLHLNSVLSIGHQKKKHLK